MIKIAIVDDERVSRERILQFIENYLKNTDELFEIQQYESSMGLLLDLDQGKYYDLFLLDIEIPKITGLELAHEIRKKAYDSAIIFVTNYNNYAIEAYEVDTFRYISKVNLEEKLKEALEVLLPKLTERKRECYIIKYYLDTEILILRDIYGLKKEGKYVVFYHKKGESRVRKTLKEVLDELDTDEFIEVGKGYIVNIGHVIEIKHREIYLRNGMIFPVGKCYIDKVKERIEQFWTSVK